MSTEVRASEIRQAIERFLETSQDPMLCEPGEEWLAIGPDNFVLEVRGACAQLQAWDSKRNLVRRVSAIESASRGKLVLRVARFGKLSGTLELIDRRRAVRDNVPLRTARHVDVHHCIGDVGYTPGRPLQSQFADVRLTNRFHCHAGAQVGGGLDKLNVLRAES